MLLEDMPVHEITEDHLAKLVNKEKERKTIEYKRDSVGGGAAATPTMSVLRRRGTSAPAGEARSPHRERNRDHQIAVLA